MRRIIPIVLIIGFSLHSLWSQNLTGVDQLVRGYGDFETPEKLAEQINKDFSSDLEKARAIYTWIASNIVYDLRSKRFTYTYRQKKEIKIKEEKRKKRVATYTFLEKKGKHPLKYIFQ
jgi:hypothetical protein